MISTEYTFSKVFKIIIVSISAVPVLLLSNLLINTVNVALQANYEQSRQWGIAGILLIVLACLVLPVVQVLVSKFIVKEDRIQSRAVFYSRELLFSQIRGYRIGDHYIIIEPFSKNLKTLSIHRSFSGIGQLTDWLNNHYPNLDEEEKEEGYQRILNDQRYGREQADRKERFNSASGLSKLMNATGVIILVLGVILRIEKYVVAAAVAAPLVFIIVLRLDKGLIRITYSKRSPVPSIFFGLFAILIFLIVKMVHYKMLYRGLIWQRPELMISILLIALLILGNSTYRHLTRSRMLEILVFSLCSFCYGFCSTWIINCCFDTGERQHYTAEVLNKWMENGGRSKSYRLQLAGWKEMAGGQRIYVSRDEYDRINIADQMHIYVYHGKLSLPWYIITDH